MRVKIVCGKCEDGYFVFDVNPGSPAPFSQNPDSPAYSDPGDPGGIESWENCSGCGTEPSAADEDRAMEAEPEDDSPEEPDEPDLDYD